jgi:hypothetical protein
VAERLGYKHDEALSLAKAVTGLNAQSKGKRLGIYTEKSEEEKPEKQRRQPAKETFLVELMGRSVPAVNTKDGIRALEKDQPVSPASAEDYLETKFRESLPAAREAFQELAKTLTPEKLRQSAYELYEEFRPKIPEGTKGWGAKGELDLALVKKLEKDTSSNLPQK